MGKKETEKMSITKYQPGNVNPVASLAFNGVAGWKVLSIFFLMLVMLLWASVFSAAENGPEWKPTGGIGIIDRIAEDEVVIDDVLYKLAANVIFYESDKLYTYANRSVFIIGTSVGFKYNENREIIALWVAK
jgi:hypothetical protein